MKAIEMSDKQLVKHTQQVMKDFERLYREIPKDVREKTSLYETVEYLKYLCQKRGFLLIIETQDLFKMMFPTFMSVR